MLAKLLAAFHLDSPDSLKRMVLTLVSALATLLVNPLLVKWGLPPLSDATLLAFASIVVGFLLQSGVKAGLMKAAAAKAGAEAAAAAPPTTVDDLVQK